MVGGEPQRPRCRVTVGDDDRLADTGGGEHGDDVGLDLVGAVAALWCGRSDRPVPRPSVVTTVRWRDRNGINPFHERAWVIGDDGTRKVAGSPSP